MFSGVITIGLGGSHVFGKLEPNGKSKAPILY